MKGFFGLLALLLNAIGLEPALAANYSTLSAPSPEYFLPDDAAPEEKDRDAIHIQLDYPRGFPLTCPNRVSVLLNLQRYVGSGFPDFPGFLKKLDFSPKCLGEGIKKHYQKSHSGIQGISFGYTIEAGLGGNYSWGNELVMMRAPNNEMALAIVRFGGWDFSLALPGGSGTQSVIYGTCDHSIYSYLGWFRSMGAGSFLVNWGTSGYNFDRTGCDSISQISGTTTHIVGVSSLKYRQVVPTVYISGPRAERFLRELDDLDRDVSSPLGRSLNK